MSSAMSAGADEPTELDPSSAGDEVGAVDAATPPDHGAEAAEATPWLRIDTIACVVLALLAVTVVGLHVRAYPTLSPIDEFQHVDYTIRAGQFDVPRRGETAGRAAMADAACRGIDAPGFQMPPCGLDEYDPADFPELGINTAASQLPPYYVVTGVLSRVVTAVTPLDSQVTAARMVGAIWLAGALTVTWTVMGLVGIRRRARAAVSVLLLATPLVVFHSATVNADALLLFTGAVVLAAAVQFDRSRLGFGWLLLVAVVSIVVEPTNVLMVTAAGLYLAARAVVRTDEPPWRRFAPLSLVPVAALLRLEILDRVQDAVLPRVASMRRAPMFRDRESVVVDVTVDRVLGQLSATFTPVQRAYLPPVLRTTTTLAFILITNWLLIGALFQSALGAGTRRRLAWWGRATALMLLAAGPFYTFYYAYFSNVDFPAPGRFALPLVPLLMVVAADALRTRAAVVVVSAVAVASMSSTMLHLLVR